MTQLSTEAILQQFMQVIEQIPFNQKLGLKLDSITDQEIIMSFSMKEELIGNFLHGILHGGVISSVLDMAGGAAAMMSAIKKHQEKTLEQLKAILGKSSTVSLHIDYVRPGKGSRFFAKASTLYSGNKVCFTRMELYNEDELLIASGAGTYLVR